MFAIVEKTGIPFQTDAIGEGAKQITESEYNDALEKIKSDNLEVIESMAKDSLKRKADKAGKIIAAIRDGDDDALAELLQ